MLGGGALYAVEEREHGEDTPMGVRVLVEAELEEDLGHVGLDRPLGDVQPLGDGPVATARTVGSGR